MSSPGATELLIVLVIVLLILGPKRLPSLGRQLGGGVREFRRSLRPGDASAPRQTAEAPVRDTTSAPAAPASAATPTVAEPDAERRTV